MKNNKAIFTTGDATTSGERDISSPGVDFPHLTIKTEYHKFVKPKHCNERICEGFSDFKIDFLMDFFAAWNMKVDVLATPELRELVENYPEFFQKEEDAGVFKSN